MGSLTIFEQGAGNPLSGYSGSQPSFISLFTRGLTAEFIRLTRIRLLSARLVFLASLKSSF